MDELEQRAIDVCREYISDNERGYCLRIMDFQMSNRMIIECKGHKPGKGEYLLGSLTLRDRSIEEIYDEAGDFQDYIRINLMK